MDGFVPAALHDVPLHHVGSTSWHDVGGLHEVRQALVETLQWPAKVNLFLCQLSLFDKKYFDI